jgi:hypothetical protein
MCRARGASGSRHQFLAVVVDGAAVGGIGITPLSDVYARTGEVGYCACARARPCRRSRRPIGCVEVDERPVYVYYVYVMCACRARRHTLGSWCDPVRTRGIPAVRLSRIRSAAD